MYYAISESHTAQTQFGHLWSQHLPNGGSLLLAGLQPSRVPRLQLLDGAEERLVRRSDPRSELGTDAFSEARGTEAADQLSGVLLTPGSVQGLVLERCSLLMLEEEKKGRRERERDRERKRGGGKEGDRSIKPDKGHQTRKVLKITFIMQLVGYYTHTVIFKCPYPKCLFNPLHQ